METVKNTKLKKPIALLLLLTFAVNGVHAQIKILSDANNLLKSGTATVHQVTGQVTDLIATTKNSTAEFNQTVKVVKSSATLSNVPSDKASKPKFKKGKFSNFKWEPVSQFDGQVFPAMIISMATYKGDIDDQTMNAVKSSALGFSFHADQSFIPVKWEIESVDKTYFDKANGNFVMENAKQDYCFMPDIPWNMSTLAKQVTSTPISIIYRLYDESGNKEERTQTVFLHSVNDCIYRYQQKSFDFLFTAFIQEQHPEVDKILKEALKTKFVTSISGYQGDEQHTLLQVCALWKVLHDRGFQYSSITATSTNSNSSVVSQQVRTFANSIKTEQANCVDGTVVFASLLRAIGISPLMVLTHDHCFLGFYLHKHGDKTPVYLETTMLAESDKIDAAKTAKQKNDAYVAQFVAAIKEGQREYKSYSAANDVKEINVDYYRNYVRPLPF